MKKHFTKNFFHCTLKSILVFLFVVGFISNSFSQPSNDSSFYPLKINFEWKYDSDFFSRSERIVDTVRINGSTYFALTSDDYAIVFLLREINNQIFIYNMQDSSEYLLFDFTADVGESWELPVDFACTYGTEITLAGKMDTVTTPLGTYFNCYHFNHLTGCDDAGIYETWFAKGVGKVKFIEIFFAGSFDFLLSDFITSIDNSTQKDYSYKLYQNYPNPFNPLTNIDFSVPNAGKVMIRVFDLLGKEIATLLDEYKQSGKYRITFDGTNLPSGIYFYKIITNNFSSTKKMVLIK